MRARFKLWLMTVTVLAASAVPALAQRWTPFGPSNVRYDLELFKPPDISAYADWPRPKEGFFFQYERLYWAIQQPSRTDIGVQGAERLGLFAGTMQFDPTTQPSSDVLRTYGNSLDTGFLRADQTWGSRFELGFMEEDKGWFVSVMNLQDQDQDFALGTAVLPAGITIVFRDPQSLLFGFTDTNSDSYDDDWNLFGPITPVSRVFGVFGRPLVTSAPTANANLDNTGDGIPDVYAGFTDFGDQMPLVPLFDTIIVKNVTNFSGVEINRSWRYPPTHIGGVWEGFIGVRWLLMRDRFDVTATAGGDIDPLTGNFVTALPGTSFWNTSVDNNMFGLQIGARYDYSVARFRMQGELRFLPAVNFQSIHQVGELGSALVPIDALPRQNVPFLMTRTSFQNSRYEETFAPVLEYRVNVGFQLTQAIMMHAGYGGMVGGGVSRASRRVDYVLPAIKIFDGNRNDAWFTNGLELGISVNR